MLSVQLMLSTHRCTQVQQLHVKFTHMVIVALTNCGDGSIGYVITGKRNHEFLSENSEIIRYIEAFIIKNEQIQEQTQKHKLQYACQCRRKVGLKK
jgi:uncharacterized lipoprotein YehR (DUF1307 family)